MQLSEEIRQLIRDTIYDISNDQSQRHIALQAGISPALLSLYLQGKREMSLDKLNRLYEILNLSFMTYRITARESSTRTWKICPANYCRIKQKLIELNDQNLDHELTENIYELYEYIKEEGTKRESRQVEKLYKHAGKNYGRIFDIAMNVLLRANSDKDVTELDTIGFPINLETTDIFPESAYEKLIEEHVPF